MFNHFVVGVLFIVLPRISYGVIRIKSFQDFFPKHLKQRIAFTDKKIALVYELHGLSEEEIKIVEGTGV
jgi:hypothetical protein